MTDWPSLYASRASRVLPSDVRELARLMEQPDVISFGGGIPDPSVFPVEDVAETAQRILGDPAKARVALQYSESGGYRPLREWLAGYMTGFGAPCGLENILITSGSQQGLDLIGRLFLSPGDRVLTEVPTYIGALRAFDACEASYGAIAELADCGAPAAKFAYLMPDFQNPTGTRLMRDERLALLDQAAGRGLPLVEDGAYEKLRYRGDPVPSLLALDIARSAGIEQSHVIYTGTFSKVIVPSLRIGWIVAASPVIDRLTLLKQASDLHTGTFNQMLMLELASRILAARIPVVNAFYGRRLEAVLAALEAHMPPGVTWTRPDGGMYVWVELPPEIDGAELAATALKEERVAIVSGRSFYPMNAEHNTIRLAFPQVPNDRIEEGIARLAGVLRRMIGN